MSVRIIGFRLDNLGSITGRGGKVEVKVKVVPVLN
jgi:hypothetical protein